MWSIPIKSKIGSDQAQLLISINSDPDASEGSVINSPVSLNPIKSFAINMVEIFLKFSGSFFLIHKILGAVKPSKTGLPKEFLIYDLPSSWYSELHSLVVRPSFHNMEGRITVKF